MKKRVDSERVAEAARRLASIVSEPSGVRFEEWAAALAVTAISMAQFVGTPKDEFMAGVSNNWDAWAESIRESQQ